LLPPEWITESVERRAVKRWGCNRASTTIAKEKKPSLRCDDAVAVELVQTSASTPLPL